MQSRHTLQSGHGSGSGPSEKMDPRPVENTNLMPKFTILLNISFMINSRVLISNLRIAFSNSS